MYVRMLNGVITYCEGS